MTSVDDFVVRYAAAWNTSDTQSRGEAVRQIWAEDGVYVNEEREFRGHKEIEEALSQAYDAFVAKGFTFTAHEHRAHHDCVRITWHMLPEQGGEPAGIGTEFILLDRAGRVRTDHQFIELNQV